MWHRSTSARASAAAPLITPAASARAPAAGCKAVGRRSVVSASLTHRLHHGVVGHLRHRVHAHGRAAGGGSTQASLCERGAVGNVRQRRGRGALANTCMSATVLRCASAGARGCEGARTQRQHRPLTAAPPAAAPPLEEAPAPEAPAVPGDVGLPGARGAVRSAVGDQIRGRSPTAREQLLAGSGRCHTHPCERAAPARAPAPLRYAPGGAARRLAAHEVQHMVVSDAWGVAGGGGGEGGGVARRSAHACAAARRAVGRAVCRPVRRPRPRSPSP